MFTHSESYVVKRLCSIRVSKFLGDRVSVGERFIYDIASKRLWWDGSIWVFLVSKEGFGIRS